jgi:hypothetical protein
VVIGPNAREMRPLDHLTKDGSAAVAPAREAPAPVRPGILGTTAARSEQGESTARQVLASAWRPEGAVTRRGDRR